MIVKSGEADRFVAHPPASLTAALIFGPDQGLVTERARALARSVVPDLTDPFRVAELGEDALDSDPARLSDEAAALSMTGGRRVVRVRGATNAHAVLFERFLDGHMGDALVVVEASDLNKASALRRLFEADTNAAAIACYEDNARDIAEVVRSVLKAAGLSIAAEALDDAVSRLGSDRGVTLREVEKLALYAQGAKRVELADVRAVMGDEVEGRTEDACDAAGEGDFRHLDIALQRLWTGGTSSVAVIRSAILHFQRLVLVLERKERGEIPDVIIKSLRPPVHFSRMNSFKAQLQRWRIPQLLDALDALLETEALCKTTGVPAEAVCGRALLNVAAAARTRA